MRRTLTAPVFYLSPEIDPPGDVDIELAYGRRITDQKVLSNYTRASGRLFGAYLGQLMWPQTELVQHLKKRSAFINITLEDITKITHTFPRSGRPAETHIT